MSVRSLPPLTTARGPPEFSLIDIRLDPIGTGIGKIAAAEDMAFSADLGSLELADYRKHPTRLIDLREERER